LYSSYVWYSYKPPLSITSNFNNNLFASENDNIVTSAVKSY
jgi:hypothetical protein